MGSKFVVGFVEDNMSADDIDFVAKDNKTVVGTQFVEVAAGTWSVEVTVGRQFVGVAELFELVSESTGGSKRVDDSESMDIEHFAGFVSAVGSKFVEVFGSAEVVAVYFSLLRLSLLLLSRFGRWLCQ